MRVPRTNGTHQPASTADLADNQLAGTPVSSERSTANLLTAATDSLAFPGTDLPAVATDLAIPDIVIRRLPIYVRTLRGLASQGIASVSSDELAERIGVTAAQVRRDLSYFGRFGKQGKGYDTAYLAESIGAILGLDHQWDVALAGVGNLGRAIAHYRGFGPSSFNIVALFDGNLANIGQNIAGHTVQPVESLTAEIRRRGIQIGIVAVPAAAAQTTADLMIEGGVRAILNYAPVVLKVPPDVIVREIDPVSALQGMTFYLASDIPTLTE